MTESHVALVVGYRWDKIITAKQARSIVYEFNNSPNIKLDNIFILIKDAARHGKESITIDWPGSYIEDTLIELGFVISSYTEFGTKESIESIVSWKE